MKVRIATIGKSISVDIEEEKAVCVFNTLALQLLDIAVENADHECQRHHGAEEKESAPLIRYEDENPWNEPPVKDTKSGVLGYKGFMYIKCQSCGKVKGFCSKDYLEKFHCPSCGMDTDFREGLKPLYVKCICGSKFKYMTNMDEGMFDINCLNCGNPVAVNWNDKKQVYQTIW